MTRRDKSLAQPAFKGTSRTTQERKTSSPRKKSSYLLRFRKALTLIAWFCKARARKEALCQVTTLVADYRTQWLTQWRFEISRIVSKLVQLWRKTIKIRQLGPFCRVKPSLTLFQTYRPRAHNHVKVCKYKARETCSPIDWAWKANRPSHRFKSWTNWWRTSSCSSLNCSTGRERRQHPDRRTSYWMPKQCLARSDAIEYE